mmetsp:Transcript_7538/g.23423  ORF Transcript_7538/g.23423 Transcript_7538/m.23423 type:complete len:82 (-) Transcript_7538:194-439(-)|eukprot:scaffold105041_cov36-Tisochrysis_lutea.AAC.1
MANFRADRRRFSQSDGQTTSLAQAVSGQLQNVEATSLERAIDKRAHGSTCVSMMRCRGHFDYAMRTPLVGAFVFSGGVVSR